LIVYTREGCEGDGDVLLGWWLNVENSIDIPQFRIIAPKVITNI